MVGSCKIIAAIVVVQTKTAAIALSNNSMANGGGNKQQHDHCQWRKLTPAIVYFVFQIAGVGYFGSLVVHDTSTNNINDNKSSNTTTPIATSKTAKSL